MTAVIRQSNFLLLLIILFFLQACTRPDVKQSTVRVRVPSKLTAMSNLPDTDLESILINVTGKGIDRPIVYQWKICDACAIKTPPTQFELNVPTGENRLFQVLALYSSQTTDEFQVFYGDLPNKTLAAANESAEVNLELKSTAQVKYGMLQGRYLDAVGSGPTGNITALYDPGSGKPLMEFFNNPIINGWFQTSIFAGLKLSYRINGNPFISPDSIDLTDPLFLPSTKVLGVSIPDSWEGSTAGQRNFKSGSLLAIGFWGPGSTDSKYSVCYPSTGALTKLYTTNDTSGSLIGYSVEGGDPTTNILVTGGAGCGLVNEFREMLSFDPVRIENYGISFAAGYMRMFSYVVGGDNQQNPLNFNSGVLTIKPLPDISYQKLVAYKLVSTDHRDFKDRDLCPEIISGRFQGWKEAGGTSLSGPVETPVSLNISQAEMTDLHLALCPFQDGQLRPGGLMISFWRFANKGGGGGNPYYTRFEGLNKTLTKDFCHQFYLKTYYYNGSSSNLENADVNLKINLTPKLGGQVYSDSGCGTAISSLTIASGANSAGPFYVKVPNPGAFDLGASIDSSSVGTKFGIGSDPNYTQQQYTVGSPYFVYEGPNSTLMPNECYAVDLSVKMADGSPYNFPSGASNIVQVTIGSVLAGAYSSLDCTSGLATQFSIASNQNHIALSLKSANSNATSAQIQASYAGFGSISFPLSLSATANTASSLVTNINISGLSSTPSLGTCYPVDIELQNEDGVNVSTKNKLELPLSNLSNVSLFDDPNCNNQQLQTVIFDKGRSFRKLFARHNFTGTFSVQLPTITTPINLTGAVLSGTIATPSASGAPYLSINIPYIDKGIIGSDEFGADRSFTFSSNADSISCQIRPSGSACPADVITFDAATRAGTFKWKVADAIANNSYDLSLRKQGYDWKMINLDPMKFAHPDFKVLNCNQSITASGDVSAINTALSGINSGSTLCLGPALNFTNPSNLTITLGNKNLVGNSNSPAQITVPSQSPGIAVSMTGSSFELVANLAFNVGDNQKAIDITASGANKLISGVVINQNSSAAYCRGIEVNDAPGMITIVKSNFTIQGSFGANYGLAINGSGPGTNMPPTNGVFLKSSKMVFPSGTTNGLGIKIESSNNNDSRLFIVGSEFEDQTAAGMTFITVNSMNNTKNASVFAISSSFTGGSNSTAFNPYTGSVATPVQLNVMNSYFKLGKPIVLATSLGGINFSSYQSIYHLDGDSDLVSMTAENGKNFFFTSNHFVKISGATNNNLVGIPASYTANISHGLAAGSSGGNRFCSTISGFGFGSINGSGTNNGGFTSIPSVNTQFTSNLTHFHCK